MPYSQTELSTSEMDQVLLTKTDNEDGQTRGQRKDASVFWVLPTKSLK